MSLKFCTTIVCLGLLGADLLSAQTRSSATRTEKSGPIALVYAERLETAEALSEELRALVQRVKPDAPLLWQTAAAHLQGAPAEEVRAFAAKRGATLAITRDANEDWSTVTVKVGKDLRIGFPVPVRTVVGESGAGPFLAGFAEYMAERNDPALARFEKLAGDSGELAFWAAAVRHRSGDNQRAVERLEALLAGKPGLTEENQAAAELALGWLLNARESGNPRARSLLEKAAQRLEKRHPHYWALSRILLGDTLRLGEPNSTTALNKAQQLYEDAHSALASPADDLERALLEERMGINQVQLAQTGGDRTRSLERARVHLQQARALWKTHHAESYAEALSHRIREVDDLRRR